MALSPQTVQGFVRAILDTPEMRRVRAAMKKQPKRYHRRRTRPARPPEPDPSFVAEEAVKYAQFCSEQGQAVSYDEAEKTIRDLYRRGHLRRAERLHRLEAGIERMERRNAAAERYSRGDASAKARADRITRYALDRGLSWSEAADELRM